MHRSEPCATPPRIIYIGHNTIGIKPVRGIHIKVFVTDANYKHSLGAIRSLGAKGMHTIAGSQWRFSASFCSNYCSEKIIYPHLDDEGNFIRFMTDYLEKNKVDVLLPIGYHSTATIERHREELGKVTRLALASRESMEIAANKDKTMRFAEKIGIPSPKTYADKSEVETFPVVAKPAREIGGMRYVNSKEELARVPEGFVIQDYIPGEGYGLFSLFNKGKLRAVFMHKRIREFPITGGASTAAESVFIPELKEAGLKLLTALNWHGVAMAEFKLDSRDGKFKLMEINPKFWGSLDLAIACGVDFPYLAVMMAYNGDVEPVMEYKAGVRFKWTFPDDFMHFVAYPSSAKEILRDTLHGGVVTNMRWDDPLPNVYQIALSFARLGKLLKGGVPRYPHGVPKLIA